MPGCSRRREDPRFAAEAFVVHDAGQRRHFDRDVAFELRDRARGRRAHAAAADFLQQLGTRRAEIGPVGHVLEMPSGRIGNPRHGGEIPSTSRASARNSSSVAQCVRSVASTTSRKARRAHASWLGHFRGRDVEFPRERRVRGPCGLIGSVDVVLVEDPNAVSRDVAWHRARNSSTAVENRLRIHSSPEPGVRIGVAGSAPPCQLGVGRREVERLQDHSAAALQTGVAA